MPRIARGFTLTLSSMIAVLCVVTGVIQVDRVVTAPGIVVAKASPIVVQPDGVGIGRLKVAGVEAHAKPGRLHRLDSSPRWKSPALMSRSPAPRQPPPDC